jgi:hypothetical protein
VWRSGAGQPLHKADDEASNWPLAGRLRDNGRNDEAAVRVFWPTLDNVTEGGVSVEETLRKSPGARNCSGGVRGESMNGPDPRRHW